MMPVKPVTVQAEDALDDAIEVLRDGLLLSVTRFGMTVERLAAAIKEATPKLQEAFSAIIQAQIDAELPKVLGGGDDTA